MTGEKTWGILLGNAIKECDKLRSDNERLKEALRWIPVTERMPDDGDIVEAKTSYGAIDICRYRPENIFLNAMRSQHSNGDVVAWRKIPEAE